MEITGTLEGFNFNNSGDKNKLLEIRSWNNISLGNNGGNFYGCSNLNITAVDSPNLNSTTNFENLFRDATSLNADLSSWDVSNISNMSGMFSGASSFHQDLSSWCVATISSEPSNFDTGASAWVNDPIWRPQWGTCPLDEFISTWDTNQSCDTCSASGIIKLPLEASGTYNFIVDWGDGDVDQITSYNQAEVTHVYAIPGTYTIRISGILRGFRFNNAGDKAKITDISQWGSLRLGNNGGYFFGASNLNISASDSPDLAGFTTTLHNAFKNATSLNGNLSNWDVSGITTMSSTFEGATSFNQDLRAWDTANVTSMYFMFNGATSYNQNLSSWCVNNISEKPAYFDNNASAWSNDPAWRPQWGTCP